MKVISDVNAGGFLIGKCKSNYVNGFILKCPEHIRKVTCTINALEKLYRQLRKIIKNQVVFPSDESLIKNLYLAIQNVMKKMDSVPSQLGFDNFTTSCYV